MTTMLVHDYSYVGLEAEEVVSRLISNAGGFLGGLANAAEDEGEALRMRIGPQGAYSLISKNVRVVVGEPLRREKLTVVPIRWEATGTPGLFPALTADLEIAELASHYSQITLQGRYDPPLGWVGDRINRLVMHRVAEASVRGFLTRLTAALTAPEGLVPQPA